jgi:aldehyde dehydrogenase (NAD+)
MATILDQIRSYHRTIHPQDMGWRERQLTALKSMLIENTEACAEALHKDLRKSAIESYTTETGFLLGEIDHALKNFKDWARPQKAALPIFAQPGSGKVLWEPLGVALIIGAWNYPLQLVLAPLVPCIAAGNAGILKPSELAPSTSRFIATTLPRYLDPRAFTVVEGGAEETSALLKKRFDKIFFTGSSRVGRIVMAAAAKTLTPVTLELGGKSPCIVDKSADVKVAARRLTFGKFVNAGQTCVAPDYVLAHADIFEALLGALKTTIRSFYGEHPRQSRFYARIINAGHHRRLVDFMSDGEVVIGGEHDSDDLYMAPTVLKNVSPAAPVMQEEIFGPILPVLPVGNIRAAINFVHRREKPLSLYLFAEDSAVVEKVTAETAAGGMCINDCLMHLAVPGLPFGGVGESGMGKYHGEWGFRAFSNAKAVLEHSTRIDPGLRYPPYSGIEATILRKLLK